MGQRQPTFFEQIKGLERELLALKQVKTVGGLLESYVFQFADSTSVAGKHYLVTYEEGEEPIFAVFTATRSSVYYTFRTPNADHTQILSIYDTSPTSAQVTFILGTTRPVVRVQEMA